jgi:hypothetical protein
MGTREPLGLVQSAPLVFFAERFRDRAQHSQRRWQSRVVDFSASKTDKLPIRENPNVAFLLGFRLGERRSVESSEVRPSRDADVESHSPALHRTSGVEALHRTSGVEALHDTQSSGDLSLPRLQSYTLAAAGAEPALREAQSETVQSL